MLVLARKSNELIHIGDSITVKVISIRNGQVKLGIEAPRDMRVTRDGRRDGRGGLSPLQGDGSGMSIEARGGGSPGDHKEV
jgi:carbon storage regulator